MLYKWVFHKWLLAITRLSVFHIEFPQKLAYSGPFFLVCIWSYPPSSLLMLASEDDWSQDLRTGSSMHLQPTFHICSSTAYCIRNSNPIILNVFYGRPLEFTELKLLWIGIVTIEWEYISCGYLNPLNSLNMLHEWRWFAYQLQYCAWV